jgi:methyl-accepting chemotaxis protein
MKRLFDLMKTSRSSAALVALSLLLPLLLPPGANSQPLLVQEKPAGVVGRLLDQSGYPYTKAGDGVWSIPFTGKALPQFKLIAATTPPHEIVVLFVILAEKAELKLSPELMLKLLNLNHDMDRVKISIDKDGDLNVRVDLSIRRLDVEELKTNIEQLSAAADELYSAIKPFLTSKK